MKLTADLLIGLGFIETDNSWVDDHCRIYKDQLPSTLKEFKSVLTGKAFNKGKKTGLKQCEEVLNESNYEDSPDY